MKIESIVVCLMAALALVHARSQSCTLARCNDCIDYLPECEECPDGYALDDDKENCVACGTNCIVCEATSSTASSCTQCNSGYFISSTGACEACSTNCQNCTSSTVCTTCNTGYYVTDVFACANCPSNCDSCSSSDVCGTCREGYYKTDGTCSSCPSNALTCDKPDPDGDFVVSTCKDSYEVSEDATECLQCASDCATCSNQEETSGVAECTSCEDESYLDGGACEDCVTKCKTCEDATDCSECVEEHTLKSADVNTCQYCSTLGCACSISAAGVESCSSCAVGYYDATGTCTKCPSGCTACDDGTTCTECEDGYGLDTDDNLCKSLPSKCTTVVAGACTVCEDGYFPDTDDNDVCKTCGVLMTNCVDCSDATTCTECIVGWTVSSDASVCEECGAECSSCANSDTAVCTGCKNGNFAPDCTLTCARGCVCSDNTDEDATEANCDTCIDGYYTDGSSCSSCDSSCLTCSSGDSCLTCETDEGKDIDGLCQSCMEHCTDCDDNDYTTCTTCSTGYIDDADGQCVACPDNCETCSWDNDNSRASCTTCKTGYEETAEGQCAACPLHCDTCALQTVEINGQDTDLYVCTTCENFYGLNMQVCPPCPSNCETCQFSNENGIICTECEEKYTVFENECTACPSNCLECSSPDVCTDCADGFGLTTSRTCSACADLTLVEHCSECSDQPQNIYKNATCYECADGYYLRDNVGLQSEGAECVVISDDLQCQGEEVEDQWPTCRDNECDAGFELYEGECLKKYFFCADPVYGTPVDIADCIVDNSTSGVQFTYCPGKVLAWFLDIPGAQKVLIDCEENFENLSCDNEGCVNTEEGEACVACCNTPLCADERATIKESYGSAAAISSSICAIMFSLILAMLR